MPTTTTTGRQHNKDTINKIEIKHTVCMLHACGDKIFGLNWCFSDNWWQYFAFNLFSSFLFIFQHTYSTLEDLTISPCGLYLGHLLSRSWKNNKKWHQTATCLIIVNSSLKEKFWTTFLSHKNFNLYTKMYLFRLFISQINLRIMTFFPREILFFWDKNNKYIYQSCVSRWRQNIENYISMSNPEKSS